MLWIIAAVLTVLWLLGLVGGFTMGGFIYAFLGAAIAVAVFRLISGRKLDWWKKENPPLTATDGVSNEKPAV